MKFNFDYSFIALLAMVNGSSRAHDSIRIHGVFKGHILSSSITFDSFSFESKSLKGAAVKENSFHLSLLGTTA